MTPSVDEAMLRSHSLMSVLAVRFRFPDDNFVSAGLKVDFGISISNLENLQSQMICVEALEPI